MSKPKNAFEIFRLLDKSNCGQCGVWYRAKEHAGSRGHGMLRIAPKPGRRVQWPGELLREKALLVFSSSQG